VFVGRGRSAVDRVFGMAVRLLNSRSEGRLELRWSPSCRSHCFVPASPELVFALADDHSRLSSHADSVTLAIATIDRSSTRTRPDTRTTRRWSSVSRHARTYTA